MESGASATVRNWLVLGCSSGRPQHRQRHRLPRHLPRHRRRDCGVARIHSVLLPKQASQKQSALSYVKFTAARIISVLWQGLVEGRRLSVRRCAAHNRHPGHRHLTTPSPKMRATVGPRKLKTSGDVWGERGGFKATSTMRSWHSRVERVLVIGINKLIPIGTIKSSPPTTPLLVTRGTRYQT
jgi:hypothetical protein